MSTYNELVTELQNKLNRTDCTTTLAGYFVNDSIRRIERAVRLPCMERQLIVTATGTMDYIMVPPDLLQIRGVLGPSMDPNNTIGLPLKKIDFDQLLRLPRLNAWPRYWAREQNQIYVRGAATTGQAITLRYYGQFSPFTPASGSTDPGTGTNEISLIAPDLITFGALSFAGDYFEHPKAADWLTAYNGLLEEVQQIGDTLENDGGPTAVQRMYGEGWME
jgi:hypothetical protein